MNSGTSNSDLNMKIAASIIDRMTSQSDLLLGISMAICGGIIALYLQLLFKNEEKKISIKGINFITACFVFQGISIIFSYLLNGSVISLTPSIYNYANPLIENWTFVDFPGSQSIRLMGFFQFVFFIIGVFFLIFVILRNKSQLSGGLILAKESNTLGVSKIYESFVNKRIESNYMGYENEEEFKDGFVEFCGNYSCYENNLSERENILFEKLSEAMIRENRERFSNFYEENIKNNNDFESISEEDLLKEIKIVSRNLFIRDFDEWDKIFKITYIWPFCQQAPDLRF